MTLPLCHQPPSPTGFQRLAPARSGETNRTDAARTAATPLSPLEPLPTPSAAAFAAVNAFLLCGY